MFFVLSIGHICHLESCQIHIKNNIKNMNRIFLSDYKHLFY